MKQMVINKTTVVMHKKSGLTYLLVPKPNICADAFYLTANDGRVTNGQMIYKTPNELDELFTVKSS